MRKVRTIRLSDKEQKLVEEFLEKNPFFDFSSLARTAIISFITAPTLKLKPVKQDNLNGEKPEASI